MHFPFTKASVFFSRVSRTSIVPGIFARMTGYFFFTSCRKILLSQVFSSPAGPFPPYRLSPRGVGEHVGVDRREDGVEGVHRRSWRVLIEWLSRRPTPLSDHPVYVWACVRIYETCACACTCVCARVDAYVATDRRASYIQSASRKMIQSRETEQEYTPTLERKFERKNPGK